LALIDGITDVPALMTFVAKELKVSNGSIIGFNVGPDIKNSSVNIVLLSQTGIGLPEKGYYSRTDSSTLSVQKAYKRYISTLFELIGYDATTAARNAEVTYSIEKRLSDSHKTNIERRDVKANYNKLAVADITRTQSHIGWSSFLKELGAPVDSVNMQQPAYYDQLNTLLKTVPITDWKIYLKAKSLNSYANFLREGIEFFLCLCLGRITHPIQIVDASLKGFLQVIH